MNHLNLYFFAALIGVEDGLFRTKAPFWPEWDGLVHSREEFKKRAVRYFHSLIREETDISVQELFFRQPDWRFDGETDGEGPDDGESEKNPTVIRPLRVNCPVFVDRKKRESADVPFDVFVSRPRDRRTVWVPFLDRVFTIPAEGDPTPPIVEELKRIIAREKREENPEFLDQALRVSDTVGFLFQINVSLPETKETESDNSSIFCPPDSLGMREIAAETVSAQNIFGVEQEIERMTEAFDQPIPESVLLLGPPGGGKTALWRRFVAETFKANLFDSFWEADVVLLAGQDHPPEKIEGLGRWTAGQESKALFHLGNLWEIDQTGKGVGQNRSLADCLTPLISRGTLPSVAECTPEQYADLGRTHPSILAPWTVISLPDPTPERNLRILKAMNKSLFHGVFSTAALTRLEALLRRYSSYEAVPGAAAALMGRPSLSKEKKKGAVGEREVTEVFAEESGLPLFLLDPAAELDRKATRRFFLSRVMGQGGDDPIFDGKTSRSETPNGKADGRPCGTDADTSEGEDAGAVPILLDLIEAIKARVTKSDGPIASLLFIGPTGVGKTELAKTLAEFFYGSPKKMVRIDMNEYGQYGAADRLINGTEDGGGLLTSAVRAQPFGVVLLDEFEKAHPSVFDLLLQILGEGRLSDARGRTADFRNSVIILTSNLGMENYGKKSLGFDREKSVFSAAEHFTAEVARLVRPELLNRIDRIVPFRPLTSESLRRILDREWELLMKRQGIAARRLTFEMDDAVKEELVRLGYDPRYGARPLRRTLEREILLPLAERLADLPLTEPLLVRFALKEGKIRTAVKRLNDKTQRKTEMTLKESAEKTLQALAEARYTMDEFRNQSVFRTMRREVRGRLRQRNQSKDEFAENGEAWRYYQNQEESKAGLVRSETDFEKKTRLLARLDREYDEFFAMEAEASIRWDAGRPCEFDEETVCRKWEELRRYLYLECRPDAKNSSFWFISRRQDFLLFYIRLFDEFCRKSQCSAEFWVPKEKYNGPIPRNAPEMTDVCGCYPWAFNKERTVIEAEPILSRIRQEGNYPIEFQKKEARFTTLWKMSRDRNGDLIWPDFITQSDAAADRVLMTGVDAPYLRRLFSGLINRHRGSYKKAEFELDFFCAGKTPADFLDFAAFEKAVSAPGRFNTGSVWKFSGNGRLKPWIPWKTAELVLYDRDTDALEELEYDLEKKDSFPEILFLFDINIFYMNLSQP